MSLFDHFESQKEEFESKNKEEHKGPFTHQLLAGAAAFEAAAVFSARCEKDGKPIDHATSKQYLAGLADGAVDKLIETKGLDAIDRIRVKRYAEEQLNKWFDEEYA